MQTRPDLATRLEMAAMTLKELPADIDLEILRLIEVKLKSECAPGRRALLELTRIELLGLNSSDKATLISRASSRLPSAEPLSSRELEVLVLLSCAMSGKSIARLVHLSPGTIKWHVRNIYGKLGARSREEALSKARALRILV